MGFETVALSCPRCSAAIPAADININRLVAKCGACNTVFSFASDIPAPLRQQAEPAYRNGPRPAVPLPPSMEFEQTGKSIVVRFRWWKLSMLFLAFFCLFWDGFMVVWFTIAISQGLWHMALFGLLHGAVGVGLTYFLIASFFNSTSYEIDGAYLRICHGPLPWWGNCEIPTNTIEQFYTSQAVHRGKHGVRYSYELHAMFTDGRQQKLLSGFDEVEQALYIEQESETFLGITDRAVAGEVARG